MPRQINVHLVEVLRVLPNFIIVGASRSGTSTLHRMLRKSGSVFMPEKKELQFFNDDRRFSKGEEWYRAQFRGGANQVAGEASPPYFHRGILLDSNGNHRWSEAQDSPARIAGMLPKTKIVISLRNPFYRAQSQFWKSVWQGRETVSDFDQAVADELAGRRPPERTYRCWLYKNAYSIHVSRWIDLFGADRVLLLNFDEWTNDPTESMEQLEQFLNLPIGLLPRDMMGLHRQNSGRRLLPGMRLISRMGKHSRSVRSLVRRFGTRAGYPGVSTKTFRDLQDYFRDDIKQLQQITGHDFSAWLGS